VRFDHQQAQELADDVEAVAEQIPLIDAAIGALLGSASVSLIAGEVLGAKVHIAACLLGLVGGAALGFMSGKMRALQMQVQAMLSLGQLQMERNTRKEKPVAAEPQAPPTGSSVRRDPPQIQKTVLARPPAQKAAP
jgi:hypothetical protein